LGLNGAGKTTTFKILTGEIDATEGRAFINGFDINRERMKARSSLGFCPQFDYLPEYLTVTQAFELFAGLRGLERSSIEKTLNELIDVFKLNEFTKKQVQTLSGGNKRKVSSGIAFIGRPSVIILDEPTTGMDPSARRYLWTVIKKARDLGLTIVLTTHSMEECEALSTRLGIMVNGQFKCMGSIQHLKSKFGKGYSLVVKCKNLLSEEEIDNVQRFIAAKIPASVLKDKQQETLFYQIEYQDNQKFQTIAELFTLIESNKDSLNIETYSLSQTTLEQVFLSFAKEQHNIDEKDEQGKQKLDKENLYKKEKSNMSIKNGKLSREQSSDRSVQDDVV
jgi:ABC-type multidrug transport system ATPase subunit